MPSPPFDQARTVRFDLARGSVVHEGARHVLVPIDALDELAKSSAPVVTAVAELIGAAMGRRIRTKLGSPRGASLEAFANQLGGELAIAGYGTLALERWGRAMVIALEQTPLASSLVVPLLASALGTAAAQRV